ncbi:MAG: GspH/FimT family pseudopilin [Woeseiaceae bacterium]
MHKTCRGLTLFELLVTMVVLVILTGIAVPNIEKMVANGRIRTETDALFHAVHLARKESIMRRRVVSICPSDDGLNCSTKSDWSNGWLMFDNLDRDEPPRLDPGEPVLRVRRAAESVRIIANRRGFTLRATEKRATNGTLVVCDRQNRVAARALVVSYTGRPRVALRQRNGDRYFCID